MHIDIVHIVRIIYCANLFELCTLQLCALLCSATQTRAVCRRKLRECIIANHQHVHIFTRTAWNTRHCDANYNAVVEYLRVSVLESSRTNNVVAPKFISTLTHTRTFDALRISIHEHAQINPHVALTVSINFAKQIEVEHTCCSGVRVFLLSGGHTFRRHALVNCWNTCQAYCPVCEVCMSQPVIPQTIFF